MPNLPVVKKISAILLSCSFLINCIVIPFCNFQDTVSAKILFAAFLQKDRDADVLEFITLDMLNISNLFEEDDDDEADEQIPASQQHQLPVQPIQISPGFLYCVQTQLIEKKELIITPRVFCSFIDMHYEMNFSSAIFHPPSCTC
jgi:hypothetical protein